MNILKSVYGVGRDTIPSPIQIQIICTPSPYITENEVKVKENQINLITEYEASVRGLTIYKYLIDSMIGQ